MSVDYLIGHTDRNKNKELYKRLEYITLHDLLLALEYVQKMEP